MEQEGARQQLEPLSLWRGTGACLYLLDPAAGSQEHRDPHTNLCRVPQHAENLKLEMWFQLVINKLEVGCHRNLECQPSLRSPVEAGTGLPAC